MGDVIDLHGQPARLEDDHEFVSDMARFSESILSEKALRKKYRMFDDTVWEKLADDDNLVRAIEAESVRRIKDGSSKREKSQQLIVKGPDILDSIMSDPTANARHRIDSCKVLNDLAANGPGDPTPAADRFQIIIRLDADTTLQFDKSIRVLEPGEVDPADCSPDTAPQELLAVVASKRSTENGGGQESI